MLRRAFLLTLGASLASGARARPQTPIVIRFSHVVAADTPKGKGALRFKQLAEQATSGRVRIDVYPDGSLYQDQQELEALQLGAVQMLVPALTKFGALGVRQFEVFDLPYIFPSTQVLKRVTEGAVGRALLDKLEPKGIRGLAYWDGGFKDMSANRPLLLPADFRGLKMRIQSSRALDAQMRALGAVPQVMAFSEVYQGLRAGLVDGTENPASTMYAQKMHEVQSHLTVSNHGYLGHAVIVNRKFWDGLPTDLRVLLEIALRDATRYTNAIAQRENEQAMELIRMSGRTEIHVLSDQEKAAWRAALLPVQEQMAERIGRDVIAAVNAEAATEAARENTRDLASPAVMAGERAGGGRR